MGAAMPSVAWWDRAERNSSREEASRANELLKLLSGLKLRLLKLSC